MAETGILLRRNTKANLIIDPPIEGELVFATDTYEIGVLDNTVVTWNKLGGSENKFTVFEFTATEGQTIITGLDDNGNTLSIDSTLTNTQVQISGIQLSINDFTLTDNDTITLNTGAEFGQLITVTEYL